MKPTNILRDEHRLVEQVLNCLERMAERGVAMGGPDAESVHDAIVFFRTYVHGWHFPREEAYIAIALESESAPGGGHPSALHDHDRCRTHLRGMEDAVVASLRGDARAPDRFIEHARSYVEILMKHVEEEEDILFCLIDSRPHDERNSLAVEAFRRATADRFDGKQLRECIGNAHRLADRFNVPRALPSDARWLVETI